MQICHPGLCHSVVGTDLFFMPSLCYDEREFRCLDKYDWQSEELCFVFSSTTDILQAPSKAIWHFCVKTFPAAVWFLALKTSGVSGLWWSLLQVQTLRMDAMKDLTIRTCCLTDFKQLWVGQIQRKSNHRRAVFALGMEIFGLSLSLSVRQRTSCLPPLVPGHGTWGEGGADSGCFWEQRGPSGLRLLSQKSGFFHPVCKKAD